MPRMTGQGKGHRACSHGPHFKSGSRSSANSHGSGGSRKTADPEPESNLTPKPQNLEHGSMPVLGAWVSDYTTPLWTGEGGIKEMSLSREWMLLHVEYGSGRWEAIPVSRVACFILVDSKEATDGREED